MDKVAVKPLSTRWLCIERFFSCLQIARNEPFCSRNDVETPLLRWSNSFRCIGRQSEVIFYSLLLQFLHLEEFLTTFSKCQVSTGLSLNLFLQSIGTIVLNEVKQPTPFASCVTNQNWAGLIQMGLDGFK